MGNDRISGPRRARSARGRKNGLAMARAALNAAAEQAVVDEDEEKLVELLAMGVDPDHCFAADGSMLLVAAAHGQAGMVRALLEAGADPDLPSEAVRGGALAWSVYNRSSECVELLLAAGADPSGGRDRLGQPLPAPANRAAAGGRHRVLELLGKAGADMDRVDVGGKHALLHAVDCAVVSEDAACVRLCLEFGADPDCMGPKMKTAAMCAMASSFPDAMLALCEHGFDPSVADVAGMTVADMALSHPGPAADILKAWLLAREESAALKQASGVGMASPAKPRL